MRYVLSTSLPHAGRLGLQLAVFATVLWASACGSAPRDATTVATAPAAPATAAVPATPAAATTVPAATAAEEPSQPVQSDEFGAFAAQHQIDGSHFLVHASPNPDASVAYRWVGIIEEAAARRVVKQGAKPTIISRDMMISCTGMYDAWACYDAKALGTRLGASLRRPLAERTSANQESAIGYAVTRCLEDLYPEDRDWIDTQAVAMGVDPKQVALGTDSPAGIGNTVAATLLAFRHHDGANQLGDEVGCTGKPYSDYTFYRPKHGPNEPADPDSWRPIPFSDGKGGTIRPGFLTPHWYRVIPVGMDRADQFRPGPPPKADSELMKRDVDECIACNGHLTLEQKALVEFMRDGPRSTGQSGHWLLFAMDLSHRDHYGLDQDVKVFFCVANVAFDSFIACWDAKRFYDSSRPYWYVRYTKQGQMIQGYAGPGQGVKTIHAEDWLPYSPSTFVTPPFPGYTSGHATVSGASARVLELFSGSDRFEVVAKRCAGDLTEPGVPVAQIQAVNGVPSADAAPNCFVDLKLATFSATANLAALSRLLGGYHIRTDNEVGLAMGRKLADVCFAKYRSYYEGTAVPPTPAP
jgi:hypothetical protein